MKNKGTKSVLLTKQKSIDWHGDFYSSFFISKISFPFKS